jgi:hypothetical protein
MFKVESPVRGREFEVLVHDYLVKSSRRLFLQGFALNTSTCKLKAR